MLSSVEDSFMVLLPESWSSAPMPELGCFSLDFCFSFLYCVLFAHFCHICCVTSLEFKLSNEKNRIRESYLDQTCTTQLLPWVLANICMMFE